MVLDQRFSKINIPFFLQEQRERTKTMHLIIQPNI